jgi:hypothetical protein
MCAGVAARVSKARALALAICALGCASGKTIEPYGQSAARVSMPIPERVLVFAFQVSAGDEEEGGIRAKLSGIGESAQQRRSQEDATGRKSASQLADDVVSGLAEIPIPGLHVQPDTPLLGPALGVDGTFLALDAGTRSHVRAAVTLQSLVGGFFQPVHSFETQASAEEPGAGLAACLEQTAKQIVREVARFYANQGWLDPARVPK